MHELVKNSHMLNLNIILFVAELNRNFIEKEWTYCDLNVGQSITNVCLEDPENEN